MTISPTIYLPSRPRSSGRMPSDPIPQAACFQDLQQNTFSQALDPRSVPIIETSRLLSFLLTRCQKAVWQHQKSTSLLLLYCCNRDNQIPRSRTCCVQQVIISPPAWRFQRLKALYKATDLAEVDLYNDLVIGLQL